MGKIVLGRKLRGALHADPSSHHLNQLFRDGKPEPCAPVTAGCSGVSLNKLFKDALLYFIGHTDSRIPHRKPEKRALVALLLQGNAHDNLSFGCKLDGVANEVRKNLAETSRIAQEAGWNVRVRRTDELEPLLVCTNGHTGGKIVKHNGKIESKAFKIKLAGLNLGEIKDIVEHAEKRFGACAHSLCTPPLLSVQLGIQQQTRHPENAVHRRAYFVAHVGKKIAFRPIRRIGL